MLVPIYAVDKGFRLDECMPGADGKAAKIMTDEQVDQLPFFECLLRHVRPA